MQTHRFWPKRSPKFCQPKFQITLSISIPEALEEVAIKPGETIFSACSDAEIEGFDSKALPGSALTDVALDPKLDKDPLKLDEKKNRLVEGIRSHRLLISKPHWLHAKRLSWPSACAVF